MGAIQYSLFALAGLLSTANSLPYQSAAQTLQSQQPLLTGLPSNSNVTLQYVALGVGNQNYTCDGTSYVQTKSSDGALAMLYDATPYLASNPSAIGSLASDRVAKVEAGMCDDETNSNPELEYLGQHFFTSQMVPTFDLYMADPELKLSGSKVSAVPAPVADAVSWLYLLDCGDGTSNGLNTVYRVETAQGVAPSSCTAEEKGKQLAVTYAAEYWFYN